MHDTTVPDKSHKQIQAPQVMQEPVILVKLQEPVILAKFLLPPGSRVVARVARPQTIATCVGQSFACSLGLLISPSEQSGGSQGPLGNCGTNHVGQLIGQMRNCLYTPPHPTCWYIIEPYRLESQ